MRLTKTPASVFYARMVCVSNIDKLLAVSTSYTKPCCNTLASETVSSDDIILQENTKSPRGILKERMTFNITCSNLFYYSLCLSVSLSVSLCLCLCLSLCLSLFLSLSLSLSFFLYLSFSLSTSPSNSGSLSLSLSFSLPLLPLSLFVSLSLFLH